MRARREKHCVTDWIERLFCEPDLLRMGHGQRAEDGNLGLGWLYYALARLLRPATVVVIGSFRGFVPLVLAKALADNVEKGEVYFIDPSMVDNFWKAPAAVQEYFAGFGVSNIRHFLMTTQQFVASAAYAALGPVGLVFVDGYHTEEQARFDYEAFRDRLAPDGIVLFHDSVRIRSSPMYGPDRVYDHTVKRFLDTLKKDPRLQVFDFPCFDGVTLVRRASLEAK
jgi:predicted O-methyltransferase YrrM